jgi:predicted DCC family thiol-disulfide oxidoreductase YuxK
MKAENPVILFDGFCNLCSGVVTFLLKVDKKKQFRYIPLQSEKGQKLISDFNIPGEIDSVVLVYHTRFYIYSEAIIQAVVLLPFPWNIVKIFRFIPLKIRDRLYSFVAKRRMKWFSRRTECRIV